MDPELQEQPESTIGHKPAEFKHEERGKAREDQETERGKAREGQETEPFARSRARREEAEESDIGGEIRAREADQDSPLLGEPL